MLKQETQEWTTWYEAGKTAGNLRLGIHIYSGPESFAQVWTRGYLVSLSLPATAGERK